MSQIVPLFIFSLPRAGSTLLQRILTAHDQIGSTAEPWILIPFIYTLRPFGVTAEYQHHFLSDAVRDFCSELPAGIQEYHNAVRKLTLDLYRKAAGETARYFLDKTPRYSLIVDELIELFPDAKFIFLWRNPLAIAASMIETWGGKRWCLYRYTCDLYDGLSNLLRASEVHKDISLTIVYETLLMNPDRELKRLMDYLELAFDERMVAQFSNVSFRGTMGDPTGTKQYSAISNEPLDKWHRTMRNPIRKIWCEHYLNWLGPHRLAVMGYDINYLKKEIGSIPLSFRSMSSDLFRIIYGLTRKSLFALNSCTNMGLRRYMKYAKDRKYKISENSLLAANLKPEANSDR